MWFVLFVGWMLIGVSFSGNDYVFRHMLRDYYANPPSFWSLLAWDAIYWPTWAMFAPLIFWIARRYPLGYKSWYRNLMVTLFFGVVLTLLHRTVYLLLALPIEAWLGEKISFMDVLFYNLPLGFVSYCIILLLKSAENYGNAREEVALMSRLEADLTRSKLQVLTMQLQPHFIFNTLSSLSALMREDIAQADRMVDRLGAFLHLTSSEKQIVTLKEEVECARLYLEIEMIRLGDRMQVTYEIKPRADAAQVPYLILQPLVENAIKHGVRRSVAPVRIVISAAVEGRKLHLSVKDDGGGWRGDGDGYEEGVGLGNTSKRLKSVYGGAASFDLRAEDGWTVAMLELPFIPAAEGVAVAPSRL
jgi:two-component system LytT family sensor kinase